MSSHLKVVDGEVGAMSWPNPYDPDEIAWSMRYGKPTREDMLAAASFIAAYRQLFDLPQKVRNRRIEQVKAAAVASSVRDAPTEPASDLERGSDAPSAVAPAVTADGSPKQRGHLVAIPVDNHWEGSCLGCAWTSEAIREPYLRALYEGHDCGDCPRASSVRDTAETTGCQPPASTEGGAR